MPVCPGEVIPTVKRILKTALILRVVFGIPLKKKPLAKPGACTHWYWK